MKTKFFVSLKADVGKKYSAGEYVPFVKSIKAVSLTQKRPETPKGDLCAEFEVDIPEELLLPLQLKVAVEMSGVDAIVTDLKATMKELK